MIDYVRLTEDEFDAQFGHVPGPDGGFYHELATDPALLTRAHGERRLWTAVDGDEGDMYLFSGFALVNRYAYVIAARPYSPEVGAYEVILEDFSHLAIPRPEARAMNVVPLTLDPAHFTPGGEDGNYFHGPTIQIFGTYFHTFAYAVDNDPDLLQPALDPGCEYKAEALQGFYDGRYETVRIHDRDCVLIIHPFGD